MDLRPSAAIPRDILIYFVERERRQVGSSGLIGVSALAERRLRLYLLLGSIGIWCFFGVSIGDVFL